MNTLTKPYSLKDAVTDAVTKRVSEVAATNAIIERNNILLKAVFEEVQQLIKAPNYKICCELRECAGANNYANQAYFKVWTPYKTSGFQVRTTSYDLGVLEITALNFRDTYYVNNNVSRESFYKKLGALLAIEAESAG